MTKEPEFIISDNMIRQWRGACIKVAPFQEEDQCKDCEYRGKGARKGCCDFDDDAMEKIFRSRPYNAEEEKQAAINRVLDILARGKSALYEGMVDGYWSPIDQAKMDVLGWIEQEVLRQQSGTDTGTEQQQRGQRE